MRSNGVGKAQRAQPANPRWWASAFFRSQFPFEPGGAHPATVQVPVRHGAPVRSTVLYVEDNPASLELITQIIARSPNISLLTAEDGPEGIRLARARRPDVILMDINLPGISGIEALMILRADPAIAHIPVVALRANAMIGDIEKGLKAGFFRYLSKPVKVKEFMETLEVALEFAARDATIILH
jgi:CheY-like chemotaxis protein